MIIKITRMLALSGALLWSGVAMAQSGSPTGSPSGAPTGAPGGSEAGTTTTTTTTTEAIMPADGTGIEAEGVAISTEENLPATGGAPLLMALVGAMTAGGAMLGLKKMR
ncbi:MAG TPA: hypothetical protein VGB77_08420 [Abditibacteriaceae bacterium]|jgi:hypothetical protein